MTDNRLNAERGQPMLFALPQPGQRGSSDALLLMELSQLLQLQAELPQVVDALPPPTTSLTTRRLDAQLL
jgi:hypothetical protein